MKKRILATLVAALMVLSLFSACGETTSESSSEASTSSTASTESEASSDNSGSTVATSSSSEEDVAWSPYGKYEETVELHTAKRSSSAPKLLPGDTVDDNPMTRYVLDTVNVKTVTDWEAETSEFTNKLALMMTSDSLPDYFTLGTSDYLMFQQLMDDGMLADLTEVYDKVMNDHLKSTVDSYDGRSLEPFTVDGKLYGIAGGQYAYEHNILWLRQDWLDQVGITELPETIEDIENILVAFKEAGLGIGLGLHYQDVAGGYSSAYSADPVFRAFGAMPKMWVENEDGEVIYGSVDPRVKEGLAVLADWYQKGLIDPQFATRTAAGSQDALVTGGEIGAFFAPWWITYNISDLPANDPDSDLVPVNAPLDSEGKFNVGGPAPAGEVLVVSKNCEHPEAVAKVFNCEFDMWLGLDQEGADLIEETRDNGVSWTYLFPTSGVNFTYNTVVPDVGLLCKNLIENGVEEGVPTATEQDKIMARMAKEYADTGDLTTGGWAEYYGRYKASNILNVPEVNMVMPAYSYTTDSMANLKPNLDTLERTTFLQIVMGEQPVDAFDQFVEDWYAQGGQTMTDEVRAMVG